MAVQLLAPSIEVGLVTTNRAAMVDFYEGYIGLAHQADLDFPGGSMKRYAVGPNVVLKLVSYDQPPAAAAVPGGGRAQAGSRNIPLVVADVREAAGQAPGAGHAVVEGPPSFPAVPGMGWCFVADPDGNWVELVGPV
ncbi:MAG: VOC family protein [Mycobacterium sp.]|nr:VOC family protein [Mycobacterium sp.]